MHQFAFAQQIDPATGGGSISADNFNSGTFTNLSGPVITETSAGQISLGFIEFTAPAGYEWDTGGTAPTVTVDLAPGNNGNTKLAIQFDSRTASKIIFEVTATSDQGPRRPGEATFSGLRIRPTTGSLPNDGTITNTGSSAPTGQTNYGSLSMVAGAPSKIRVETQSDGSGTVVPAQDLTAGNSLTVYSISRDQNDNFLQNITADSWDIANGTEGVTSADITPAGDNKSAVFSSSDTGTGEIQSAASGLTSVNSKTITVKAAAPNAITINTQPSATATAGQNFAQQPIVDVVDVFGNRVKDNNTIQIVASRSAGSGTLQGTKTITVIQGRATYTNLKHNIANDIDIKFSASGFQQVTSNTITVNPAAASQLAFSVQPQNGSRNNALDPGPTVQIQDQFGNDVAQSGTDITITKASGPGNITNSSTTVVPTDANGAALFDNLVFDTNGTYTIDASASGLTNATSNSFEILNSGELAKFNITTTADNPIGTQTAGQSFTIKIQALDGTGALLDGTGQPEYTNKAFVFSVGNTGTGLNDSTANFSGGEITHNVTLENAGDFEISVTGENASGNDITSQSNTFTVNPAAANEDSSIIEVAPSSIVADGSSTALVTVTLKDAFGNQLTTGGDNVAISTDAGTLQGSVTPNGDGTYTQSLQSSTTAQTATISATVNSSAITSGNPTVDFVAGGLDKFVIEQAGGGNIGTQDAGQPFNIRITAQDVNGNTVTSFNGSVNITSNRTIGSGGGSVSLTSGIVDNYAITINGAGQNNVTISATNTVGTQTGTSNAFTVNPGATDASETTITAADRFIENNGTSTTTITIQAKDQFGNNRLSGGETVTLSTTAGTLQGSISDNSDGTYTQTLQSSTNVETATLSGTIGGANIDDDALVSFAEFNTWTSGGGGGPNPTTWDDAGNWTLGVPTSNQAVFIPTNPADANKFPIIKNSDPTIAFLVVESGATINVDPGQSITVNGDVSGDGALIVDAGTATIGGDISIANLSAGNSTVTLNGSEQQQIPGSLITDILNIENTSTEGITSDGYVNADTRLTVTNSTLTMESGSTLEIFNDITGNGTLKTDDATALIGGDITVNNVDFATSDVTYNGTAAQTISNAKNYRNLSITNTTAGGVTLNDTTSISQALTINSGATLSAVEDISGGTLNAAGATLRIAKDVSFTSVSSAPSTVEFFGGNPQVIGAFNPFNNLTVDKSADRVVSNDDVIVNGTLTLTSGDLVMGSGTNLLAPNRSLTGGTIRFQRDLSSPGWYALSSPVASTYNDLLDSIVTQGYPGAFYDSSVSPNDTLQPSVLYYNETIEGTDNQRYRTINDASDPIVEARGHFVFVFGDVQDDSRYTNATPSTLEVGGNEFTGSGSEVNFNVTYTAAADTGWNLVGNPYGATIDWDDSSNWTKTNMDNTIYVWDHTANGGNGDYLVWNGFTGSLGNGLIAPFQAFWVKASSANPDLRVTEDAKTTGGIFRKQASTRKQDQNPVIELQLDAKNLETSAFISFSEGASRWKDRQDAYRLTPFTDTFLEFFSSFDDGTQLTINNLPRKFGQTIEVPLFVGGSEGNQSITGNYTISWPNLDQVPSEWEIILIDQRTNEEIDIRRESFYSFDVRAKKNGGNNNAKVKGQYTVASKSNTDNARFTLRINPGADAGQIPSTFSLGNNYPNPFNPTTTIPFDLPLQSKVTISVYNIIGQKVATIADRTFEAGSHTVKWSPNALASGVYLFILQTDQKRFTQKMTFIK
ncbi:MAG: invasin domain 3-containing protein [Balneolaceae bacterium]|nr:invasin domain 3-containing protein [Balneolaceae bacterium]